MTRIRKKTTTILGALSLLAAGAALASEAVKYPDMTDLGGISHTSTCTPKNKKELLVELRQLIPEPAKQASAWKLLDTLFCGKATAENHRYVTSVTTAKISFEQPDMNTGEMVASLVERDSKLIDSFFSEGRVWEATIRGDQDDFEVQYFSDEASVSSFKFRYVAGKWYLVGTSNASD